MAQQHLTSPNPPIAAIDVGSNTIHLVVAIPHKDDGERLETLVDELEFVRLGAGVGATGRIDPERARRGMATIKRLRNLARQAGASIVLGAATEVMRLAANGPEFLARARAELGLEIPIISGDQEAAFTFWGAISARDLAPEQPVAVADLGGGSIELVLGRGRRLDWRHSLPLGSGALHDRFVHSDPPTADELHAVRDATAATLETVSLPDDAPEGHLFIACGGTATTLLFFAQRALNIPAGRANLSRAEMEQASKLLATFPAQEIADRYAIEAQRARILGAGAAVLATLMGRLRASVMEVSQHGIREGMILSYSRHGARWLEAAQSGED